MKRTMIALLAAAALSMPAVAQQMDTRQGSTQLNSMQNRGALSQDRNRFGRSAQRRMEPGDAGRRVMTRDLDRRRTTLRDYDKRRAMMRQGIRAGQSEQMRGIGNGQTARNRRGTQTGPRTNIR
jgi:hypothetical protein